MNTRRSAAIGITCLLASLLHSAAVADERASIQFQLSNALKSKKHKPTYVAWVETKDGRCVTTVYMSKTAKWQTENRDNAVFKFWVKTGMAVAKADAVTKATPWPGTPQKLVWDLKDAKGERAPKGDYVLKFESVLQDDKDGKFAQVTSLPFSIGKRKRFFKKSRTVHHNGRKTRKPAVYVRRLSLEILR